MPDSRGRKFADMYPDLRDKRWTPAQDVLYWYESTFDVLHDALKGYKEGYKNSGPHALGWEVEVKNVLTASPPAVGQQSAGSRSQPSQQPQSEEEDANSSKLDPGDFVLTFELGK